jgi:hypothetical protein
MLRTNTNLSQTILNGSKKIAFIAALFLTVGIGSSFANTSPAKTTSMVPTGVIPANSVPTDGNANKVILASFHKDFGTAEMIGVEVRKDYTKVTFKLNSLVLFAFYSENGDLMAVVRNILSTQLPIQLLMDLKQNHSDCWITDLFEIDSNGQTTYYVTLENCDARVTLRSNSTSWEKYHG